MKRSPLSRYTPIRKSRSKPRAGRVKGKDMEALRRACFERDFYLCQGIVTVEVFAFGRWQKVAKLCGKSVTWESGHLAHIKAKRRNGDSLDNVRTLCAECHIREHSYGPTGEKPCPSKRLEA